VAIKTAEQMAGEQREISVAEFFEKNRHLLGFDNPMKALLITVKEMVDNSLDACQEAGIMPEIKVKLKIINEDRIKISVEDNGPGIMKEQMPRIFGKLLYGSKFYKMQQSRGQQGIGVSAALLYSQLTTGKATLVRSRTAANKPVHEMTIRIDTMKNEPIILNNITYDKTFNDHGTYIEMEIEGKYRKGDRSVDEYMKETAISNPFAKFTYYVDSEKIIYPRLIDKLPIEAKSIKPHPYGVELGIFERMAKNTKAKSVLSFITNDFCRVGSGTAKAVLKMAKVSPNNKPNHLDHQEIEKILKGLQKSKIMNPPTNCLSPIGEQVLEKAVQKDLKTEFQAAITRPPSVYRGMPFLIEVCIGYGGELNPKGTAQIMRFANRVPLLYQASSCAVTKAVQSIAWGQYHVEHQGNNPTGPLVIAVHMASVWIPYTSESKEALEPYPEISKEIRLAIQDCARKLKSYLAGKKRRQLDAKRKGLFEKYLPTVADALADLSEENNAMILKSLEVIVKKEKIEGEDIDDAGEAEEIREETNE